MQRENVGDWRQLVDSIMIDFNYDGAILTEPLVDIPGKNDMVKGVYAIPKEIFNNWHSRKETLKTSLITS